MEVKKSVSGGKNGATSRHVAKADPTDIKQTSISPTFFNYMDFRKKSELQKLKILHSRIGFRCRANIFIVVKSTNYLTLELFL